MKKGLLKAIGITALVAVSAVGGLALGAEISNGFEKTYSESAYVEHGNEQKEQGYKAGFEAGQEQAGGYTEEELQEAVNAEVDKWQEFLKLKSANNYLLRNLGSKELYSSLDDSVEGVFLYDPSTGDLTKLIDKGFSLNFWENRYCYYIYSDFQEEVGLHFISLNGEFVTIEDSGCGYILQGGLGAGEVLIQSNNGLKVFDDNSLTTTTIMEGSGWVMANNNQNNYLYFSNQSPDKPGLYRIIDVENVEMVASEGYNYMDNMVQYEEEEVVYWTNADGLVKINDDKTTDMIIEGNVNIIGSDLVINNTDSKLYFYKHNEGFVGTQLDFNVMEVIFLNYNGLFVLRSDLDESYIFDGEKSQVVKVVGIDNEQIYDCLAALDSGEGISKIVVFTSENKLYQIDLSTGTATLVKEHTNPTGSTISPVYITFNEDNSQSLYIIKFTDGNATSELLKENIQYANFIDFEDGNIAHFEVMDMEGQTEDLYIDFNTFEVVEK